MTTITRAVRANPPLAIGTLILACVLALTVLAPFLAPYGVAEQSILDRFQRPGVKHLLGTDQAAISSPARFSAAAPRCSWDWARSPSASSSACPSAWPAATRAGAPTR